MFLKRIVTRIQTSFPNSDALASNFDRKGGSSSSIIRGQAKGIREVLEVPQPVNFRLGPTGRLPRLREVRLAQNNGVVGVRMGVIAAAAEVEI